MQRKNSVKGSKSVGSTAQATDSSRAHSHRRLVSSNSGTVPPQTRSPSPNGAIRSTYTPATQRKAEPTGFDPKSSLDNSGLVSVAKSDIFMLQMRMDKLKKSMAGISKNGKPPTGLQSRKSLVSSIPQSDGEIQKVLKKCCSVPLILSEGNFSSLEEAVCQLALREGLREVVEHKMMSLEAAILEMTPNPMDDNLNGSTVQNWQITPDTNSRLSRLPSFLQVIDRTANLSLELHTVRERESVRFPDERESFKLPSIPRSPGKLSDMMAQFSSPHILKHILTHHAPSLREILEKDVELCQSLLPVLSMENTIEVNSSANGRMSPAGWSSQINEIRQELVAVTEAKDRAEARIAKLEAEHKIGEQNRVGKLEVQLLQWKKMTEDLKDEKTKGMEDLLKSQKTLATVCGQLESLKKQLETNEKEKFASTEALRGKLKVTQEQCDKLVEKMGALEREKTDVEKERLQISSDLQKQVQQLTSDLKRSQSDLEVARNEAKENLRNQKAALEASMQAIKAESDSKFASVQQDLQMELELERGKTVAVSGVLMESFNILLSDLPDRQQTTKLLELKDKVDRIMTNNEDQKVENRGGDLDLKSLVDKLNEAKANIAQFDSQLQQLEIQHSKELNALEKRIIELEKRGKEAESRENALKIKLKEKEEFVLQLTQKYQQANIERDRMNASVQRRLKELEKENGYKNKMEMDRKEKVEQELAEAQQQIRIYQTEIAQMRDELSLQREQLEEVNLKKREIMKKAQGVTDNTFADTYEEVMQEELDMMRNAFEKKIATLKDQLKTQSIKFSRELGESRDKARTEKTALEVKLKRVTAQLEAVARNGALPPDLWGSSR